MAVVSVGGGWRSDRIILRNQITRLALPCKRIPCAQPTQTEVTLRLKEAADQKLIDCSGKIFRAAGKGPNVYP